MTDIYDYEVKKLGHWPFAWGFGITKNGEFVYGEKNIESKRAATKDAEDMAARLSDGRLKLTASGVIYAPIG